MALRKRKPVEANDGSYAGLVLAEFDRQTARQPDSQTASMAAARPEELLGAIAESAVDHADEVCVVIEVDRTLWDAIQKYREPAS